MVKVWSTNGSNFGAAHFKHAPNIVNTQKSFNWRKDLLLLVLAWYPGKTRHKIRIIYWRARNQQISPLNSNGTSWNCCKAQAKCSKSPTTENHGSSHFQRWCFIENVTWILQTFRVVILREVKLHTPFSVIFSRKISRLSRRNRFFWHFFLWLWKSNARIHLGIYAN